MRRTTLLATTALAALALPPAARAGDGLIFAEVPAPATDAAKREVLASDRVTVGGKDHPIAYRTLLRTGDMAGGGVFGLVTDEGGRPIARDGKAMIANSTDFSSLLSVGDRLYSVLHFEARPGAVYLTELRRDPATGDLSAVDTGPVDFSALGGVWNPCAGSVTPWGTHL